MKSGHDSTKVATKVEKASSSTPTAAAAKPFLLFPLPKNPIDDDCSIDDANPVLESTDAFH
jgi:hypothetical protein